MKTCKLKFLPVALKEWKKLDSGIKNELKKILEKRLINPKVPSARLIGHKDVYKIKLRSAGYRLAYQVINDEFIVLVIAIGKREKSFIYKKITSRLN